MNQLTQQSIPFAPRFSRTAAPIERRIAGLLESNHRGRKHAIARQALAAATGNSDRQVREVIASLVTKHGLPIGAAPRGGYYWITDPDELRREASALTKKIRSLAARVRALVGGDEAARLLGHLALEAPSPPAPIPPRGEGSETIHVADYIGRPRALADAMAAIVDRALTQSAGTPSGCKSGLAAAIGTEDDHA